NPNDDFLRDVLAGSGTYGTIDLTPMLMFTPESDEPVFETNGKSHDSPASDTSLGSFQPQSSSN
ncbi:MAG TPA: ATPase, partial [Cyanobacteria bacterium UBA11049]|nr:ATPase [Cyanobacteria bacterium UBA11049]